MPRYVRALIRIAALWAITFPGANCWLALPFRHAEVAETQALSPQGCPSRRSEPGPEP